MKGFLSLEPDLPTHAQLVAIQNRLRDVLDRQGVSFPERLHAPLVVWPFATLEELDAASEIVPPNRRELTVSATRGFPNDDRPAEVGLALQGAETMQAELWARLRTTLDPDPPKPPRVRLARVAPPSRKVGIALRQANLLGADDDSYVADAIALWRQTPHGFEMYRRMRLGDGGS